ncbi:MAG: hypothetical protein ACLTKI_04680 [Lachnospiraceae bacterium]
MKVLIKGAGDLASGIACRLIRSGFQVVLTEIPVPTTVRRTVSFSRAVYEGTAMVEDIEGILCCSLEEADRVASEKKAAVLVDEDCSLGLRLNPDVVVDAILAKKNLGTCITDASVVIGVGRDLAGKDCHVVVETKRGYDLGRCIWQEAQYPIRECRGNRRLRKNG